MKVVILAGGLGSRLSEETSARPKPMVEIGGKPMLWHIMNIYAASGFCDFVVACGYKAEVIKEYFRNFYYNSADFTVDLLDGSCSTLNSSSPNWRVSVIDTGLHTMTGGRLLRLRERLSDGPFMVTYGDGLSNMDLPGLLAFHRAHGRLATVTAVRPPARFGGLVFGDGDKIAEFSEKPQAAGGWINGGFFVFEPRVLDFIGDGDETILERRPLEELARAGELMAYRHEGFWQPMDTLREKHILEAYWDSGNAPWKVWA